MPKDGNSVASKARKSAEESVASKVCWMAVGSELPLVVSLVVL